MRGRFWKGWTIRRIFYAGAGAMIMVMSVLDQQWVGVAMGAYFTAMGLFAFGCAAGQCAGSACEPDRLPEAKTGSNPM